MKIAVDLDEVLLGFLDGLVAYHNDRYGTSLKPNDFESYFFWETWGGNRQEAIDKVHDFYATDYFHNLQPIAGAQDAIKHLQKNNDLIVITSRQDSISIPTAESIERFFPETFSEIYFTNQYSNNGNSRTKKDICDAQHVDVLIEDLVEYAFECIAPGREVFLMTKPWNAQHLVPSGIIRVKDWYEIVNHLTAKAAYKIR